PLRALVAPRPPYTTLFRSQGCGECRTPARCSARRRRPPGRSPRRAGNRRRSGSRRRRFLPPRSATSPRRSAAPMRNRPSGPVPHRVDGPPRWGSGSVAAGLQLALVDPFLFFLDPLVVLREVVDVVDAADLQLGAGSERCALGPLDRLLLG